MHLTGEISLGSILIIVSILTAAVSVGRKFGVLERGLADLVKMFDRHDGEDARQFGEIRGMLERRRESRR